MTGYRIRKGMRGPRHQRRDRTVAEARMLAVVGVLSLVAIIILLFAQAPVFALVVAAIAFGLILIADQT